MGNKELMEALKNSFVSGQMENDALKRAHNWYKLLEGEHQKLLEKHSTLLQSIRTKCRGLREVASSGAPSPTSVSVSIGDELVAMEADKVRLALPDAAFPESDAMVRVQENAEKDLDSTNASLGVSTKAS